MDREAIARALMDAPTRNGKFSDFIHEDEALNAADAIISLTRTEATTGEVVREFTNELGNRIKITIEGPHSVSENILTPMEAKELRAALAQPVQDEGGVIQADREAAALLVEWLTSAQKEWDGMAIWFVADAPRAFRDGAFDNHEFVQAFAAHRRAFSREGGNA